MDKEVSKLMVVFTIVGTVIGACIMGVIVFVLPHIHIVWK